MKKFLLYCISFIAVFFVPFYSEGTSEPSHAGAANATPAVSGLVNVGFAPFNLTAGAFNCRGFLRATKDFPELHITFLYNTFGNDYSCLVKLLKDPRLKTLEVHLINEPGHRNGRLGSYEFLADVGSVNDYETAMRKRSSRLKSKFIFLSATICLNAFAIGARNATSSFLRYKPIDICESIEL